MIKTPQNFVQSSFSIKSLKLCLKNMWVFRLKVSFSLSMQHLLMDTGYERVHYEILGLYAIFPATFKHFPRVSLIKTEHRFTRLYRHQRYYLCRLYVLLCTIWYYLHNFKNVKNTHEGVLLLVKFQAEAS